MLKGYVAPFSCLLDAPQVVQAAGGSEGIVMMNLPNGKTLPNNVFPLGESTLPDPMSLHEC